MKLVFLGCFTPQDKVEELRKQSSYYDIPGGVLQNAIVSGFDAVSDLQIITSPNLKGIKGGKLESFEFSHNGGSRDYCIGYKDIPLVREISVANKMLDTLNKCGQVDVIFIYSIGLSQLSAAKRYKKTHPNVKVIEMITDLPAFMREHPSVAYKIAKNIETKLNYSLMGCVDVFALLSQHMREVIPVKDRKWVQVEGIYNDSFDLHDVEKKKERTILYTGNLGVRYGIKDLVDAFQMINNPDYRLLIRGDGECKDYVKKVEKEDSRIRYVERLSRIDLLKLQREATLLINPVHKTTKFTRYFFPSKTMEYMASGTPTLMSELDCLPEDYKQHLYFFDDESVEGMAKKIEEICSKPQEELDAFGKAASEFILENKNAVAQVKKILEALA